jgi:phosphoribosylpyrophosphate synthetase
MSRPESIIAIPPTAENFHPKLVTLMEHSLTQRNLKVESVAIASFPDQSPLVKVSEADHTLLIFWYGGENWKEAYAEIGHVGSALTMQPDQAGANTSRLGIYLPFMEARQDKRTLKAIPESTEVAIVKNQGVNTIALAREIGLVARAAYVVTQDLHSYTAAKQLVDESAFRPEGTLEHLHLTSVPLFADRIAPLITNPTQWAIGGTDLGDLNRQVPLQQYFKRKYGLDLPLIIMGKERVSAEDGTRSITKANLLHGDPTGKRILLVDDVISSGGTLRENVGVYTDFQAEELHIFAPQALFAPETFYTTVRNVLIDPLVSSITVTDILPIKKRLGKVRDIPYAKVGSKKKVVEVIDSSPLFTSIVETLASTQSIEEARLRLGDNVWDMQDPHELFQKITGVELPRKTVGALYGDGEFTPLPETAILFDAKAQT